MQGSIGAGAMWEGWLVIAHTKVGDKGAGNSNEVGLSPTQEILVPFLQRNGFWDHCLG